MLILRTTKLVRSIPIYYRSLWKAKGEQEDNKPKSQIKMVEMENYFRSRLRDTSYECSNIIKELSSSEIRQKRVEAMLQDWLSPQADPTRSIRANDLIMLLLALQFSSSENLKKYRKLALDHLLEIDIQELQLQQRSFKVLMDVIEDYLPLSKSHSRSQSWKLILLRTATNARHLSSKILLKLLPYTLTSSSENYQHLKISNVLQSQLMPLVLTHQLKSKELEEFLKMCYRYGLEKKQYADQLLRFFVSEHPRQLSLDHLINMYRYFPPFVNLTEGRTYKSQILSHLLQVVNQSQLLSAFASSTNTASVFCYSILKHLFSEFIIRLDHQTASQITYVDEQSLKSQKLPQLPRLFWQIYQQFAQVVNSNSITRHLIKACYSQHYKQTQQTSQSRKPHTDTEMVFQINQVLTELGINFTRQKIIAGRYADFCLQNNIILQVDGAHHFSARELYLTEDTLFRNAHYVLSGYRVVSLNVYEYNLARSLPQLKSLISSKLNLLESNRAVMVY